MPRIENWSQYRHDALHHLGLDGHIDAIPYLTLPLRKQELLDTIRYNRDPHFNKRRLYDITEGTIYSQAEQRIHGKRIHAAIDYHVPYGTPVAAPACGYAVASYQSAWLREPDGSIRTLEGRPIAFGLGYYIQIYVPEVDRYIQLGHLSDLSDVVHFSKPVLEDRDWIPTHYATPLDELTSGKLDFVSYVNHGDILGQVGYSGLRWGYDDYTLGAEQPVVIDPEVHVSYDEPHVHVEEFYRNQLTGAKTP